MSGAVTDPELFDRELWFAADPSRRRAIAEALARLLAPEYSLVGLRSYVGLDREVAVYTRGDTGLRFSLIPGGSFEMGMSPEEEQTILEARPTPAAGDDDFNQEFDLLLSEMGTMRPLHRVQVPPFLICQRVLTVGQVREHIFGFVDQLYGGALEVPAHLSSEQELALLIGAGLRLPSEAELEYAARGDLSRALLPTANTIPDEDLLEAMLSDPDDTTSNAFGLHGYGLYPERCADVWHEHYKTAPTDGSAQQGRGPRVVRGGAADCYPWQGCGEWNAMLCAFRQSDHAAEFGAALRPARGLHPSDAQEPPTPPPPRRSTSKKVVTKKTATKKTPNRASEIAAKKPASKATTSKKSATSKTATKQTPNTKSTTKKTAKQTPNTKSTTKKTAANKAANKKTTKTAAKKTTKTAAKKTSARAATTKSTSRKTSTKAATKKTATKAATKKTTTKAATKKTATTKPVNKRAPANKRPANH